VHFYVKTGSKHGLCIQDSSLEEVENP